MTDVGRRALAVQSGYFVATGIWPLIDDRSFQAITGPKGSMWLAKVVGALVAVVGGVLSLALFRGRSTEPEVIALAAGSAAALGITDVVFVARAGIRRVYLVDAAIEAAFAGVILADRIRQAPDAEA